MKICQDTNAPLAFNVVDYSAYFPRDLLNDPPLNPDDFFHGVMHYIRFRSGNLYNRAEMAIGYSGRQPKSDPANMIDYRSPSLFESGNGPGQCIVIKFSRIFIRPTALAIRSGPLNRTTRHLTSYVFQGYNPITREWVMLDERHSLLEFLPGYPSRLSHIDTDSEFQTFRLLQTDTAVGLGTHFSINALELHGTIRVMDDHPEPVGESVMTDEFDPWAMTEVE
jgi:hypothetical protein